MNEQLIIESYLRTLEDARRTYDYMIDHGKSEDEAAEFEKFLKAKAKEVFEERMRLLTY